MQDVRIHRLFCCARALILNLVKKDKLITPGQLYALESAARRERSLEQARLLRAGARALKAGIARALSALKWKGLRHA